MSSSAAPIASRGSQGAGPRSPSLLASLALNASAPAPPKQMIPSSQPSPPSRRAGQTRASSSATKGAVSRASAGVPGVT
ncbi:hypothetical protein D3C81_615170 [compost metagenome]